MTPQRLLWRRVLAADLGIFNVAIFFFAYLPPSTINHAEEIAMVVAAFSLIGVVSHAFDWIRLPGEQYAYLFTAWIGIYVLLVYANTSPQDLSIKVPFCLFLMSGIASGVAAHVIDGGPRDA